MSHDSWYGEESGLLQEYTGTIVESFFSRDQYNTNLNLVFEVDSPPDSLEGGRISERFGVGGGWESFDGGETITDPSRENREKLHQSTMYRRLINTCLNELNMGDVLEGRGSALEAKVWLGLRFEMAPHTFDFSGTARDGTKLSPKTRAWPVEYLGTEDSRKPTASAPSSSEIDPDLLAKLAKIRSESTTHQEFSDKAIELDEVINNTSLVQRIADENDLFKSLQTV